MRDFVIKRLRRAPVIEPLWNEFERMQAARDAALIERDAAVAARNVALIERDALLSRVEQRYQFERPWPLVSREQCYFYHTMHYPDDRAPGGGV